MKQYLIVLFVFLSFLLASCQEPLERSSLVGIYLANHKKGKDVINVKGDGTYTHHYTDLENVSYEDSGTWEFEEFEDELQITFYNIKFRWNGYSEDSDEREAFWPAPIERTLSGEIRLILSYDTGLYFLKTK